VAPHDDRTPQLAVIEAENALKYLGGAVVLATIFRFIGYAAAVSYAAWKKLDHIDPSKVAEQTFHIAGVFALIGALLLLTMRG
jgi:hypothetical protein